MGLIAPPTYVAFPTLEALRFGLYSVANTIDPTGRWEFGVEYEPIAGERAALRAHECVDDYTSEVDLRVGETTVEGIPFVVVGSYVCAAQSRSVEEAEERAVLHLAAGEERAVEYAIATGEMSNEPTFQGATDLTPTAGTAVGITEALGLIESAQALGNGSVGTIHAPRVLAAPTDAIGLVDRYGQHLETRIGTRVAFGAGYDAANVGPDGEEPSAGEYWIYGTGTPTIRRGDVFIQPDESSFINKDDNLLAIMAQRTVLVTFSDPVVAVLVDPAL